MINFQLDNKYVFYESEINRALDWLFKIRDSEEKGWAWVQFIKPNEQNTAEVVYAFAENEQWLNNNPDKINAIIESIEIWLIDTSHASISIDYCWVARALQVVRENELLYSRLDKEKVNTAIDECLEWLVDNTWKNESGEVLGWGDNSSEIPNLIRTTLAVMCLYRELEYKGSAAESGAKYEKYRKVIQSALKWITDIQNHDGGWGNLDKKLITPEYQQTHSFSYEDLRYQCDSNPASTGYVMLALQICGQNKYNDLLKDAYGYLSKAQLENGGWDVFTEIGVRNNERYTFRHFGTTWALQGIIRSGIADYRDEIIIHGFEYLANLQDRNYGGWRSSPDADNYTWATCNALSTINLLKKDLNDVHANHFLSIVWDWWTLRKKDANFSFRIGKIVFAFNSSTALLFCIVFSIMMTSILLLTITLIGPRFENTNDTLRKLIYSILIVVDAAILGLPWIVYVKNRFKSEVSGWIESIGWVYGIITGFVLVLYQFVL